MSRFLDWFHALFRSEIPTDAEVQSERETATFNASEDEAIQYMRDVAHDSRQRRLNHRLERSLADLDIVLDTLISKNGGQNAGK